MGRLSRGSCLVSALLLVGCAQEPAAGPPSRAGDLAVYQANLFYQQLGSGEPIVVIHGGPGLDHTYLRPGLDPLADTHEVILFDQRGVGGSDAVLDAESISMSRYLTDIDRVRERVAERERVTVLAHSWGAIPALLYALEAPERVERLILVSPVEPGGRYAAQTDSVQSARQDPADVAAMDSIAQSPGFGSGESEALSQFFFHVFRGTFADPALADSVLEIALHPRTAAQGSNVARLLMTPLRGLDFWDRLPDIDVPVLLLHGAEDPIPSAMVEELGAALPNAEVRIIPNAGHFPFLETPDAFFDAVRAFVPSGASD